MMRKGQVALYLVMTIVVLCVLTLMNVDVFLAVRSKNRVQNAGDAAALAAAREQGRLLNELGRLNFAHIAAAAQCDEPSKLGAYEARAEEILAEQRRLALLGPIEGLRKANEAAQRNGMETQDDFARLLKEHVATIRTVYNGGTNEQGEPYPEPWPGAWNEYATRIETAISGGLAVGPDNCEFHDAQGGHLLLNRNFYYAISGENWCWFHFNAEGVLTSYQSFHDWGDLPSRSDQSMENSEVFSLHVKAWKGALTDLFSTAQIAALSQAYGESPITEEELQRSLVLTNRNETWFLYDESVWSAWFNGLRLPGDDYEFPLVGEVKPEYNVRGCAAICRCITDTPSVSNEDESSFTWTAAAKPFGTVETDEGESLVTAFKNFVVPCFTSVRLVPMDAVGGRDLATADAGWVDHVRKHLPDYLVNGPHHLGCFYCQQLKMWENAVFRQVGINWIRLNASSCVRGTGGPGGHGGTSHAH